MGINEVNVERTGELVENMTPDEKREVVKHINSEVLFEELMVRHLDMRLKLRQIEQVMDVGYVYETA